MAYREDTTTRRPPAVVEYRPTSVLTSAGMICLLLGFAAVSLHQGVTAARSSQLECERGGPHACVLVRSYGPISTRTTFPLNRVRGVFIESHRGKNSTTYSVDFVMHDGTTRQISRDGGRSRAELTRTVIADFLEGRAVGPSKIPVDTPAPWPAISLGIFGVALGALSLLFVGSARLELDFVDGTIRYTRRRFPLRPVRRTLRRDEIEGVRVTAKPGGRGGTMYSVSLELSSGESLELVPGGGSARKAHHDAAANEIDALLAKLREG